MSLCPDQATECRCRFRRATLEIDIFGHGTQAFCSSSGTYGLTRLEVYTNVPDRGQAFDREMLRPDMFLTGNTGSLFGGEVRKQQISEPSLVRDSTRLNSRHYCSTR